VRAVAVEVDAVAVGALGGAVTPATGALVGGVLSACDGPDGTGEGGASGRSDGRPLIGSPADGGNAANGGATGIDAGTGAAGDDGEGAGGCVRDDEAPVADGVGGAEGATSAITSASAPNPTATAAPPYLSSVFSGGPRRMLGRG
jgi:hypothetical protein